MTSDCPMLQDLAFDAISSFSTGLKLSIYKGGFHTGSVSYCGKLPFQLFLWWSSKVASLVALFLCLSLLTT